MKVNFSEVLTDVWGEPLRREKKPATATEPAVIEDMTAANASVDALMIGNPDEKSGDKKIRLFTLALRIANGGEQDIEVEDVVLLKERIAAVYAPVVVGRMYELLKG